MSPKNKIKLKLLREKLDNLDYQLLKIIKKRTELVKKVLILKKYNPATRKHEVFVEKKLPPHSK